MNRLEQPSAIMAFTLLTSVLAAKRRPRAALCLIAAPALAFLATSVLKRAVDRPRPLSHLFRKKGLESFPSSHTAGKAALTWMIARAFPAKPRARYAMATATGANVALLGCERVACGAHWPTDTLAGAVLGVAAAELVARAAGCPRDD
jgi:undecaprenyl-diphosphatase